MKPEVVYKYNTSDKKWESEKVITDVIDLRLNNIMLTDNLSLELGVDYGKGNPPDKLAVAGLDKSFFDKDGWMGTIELTLSEFVGGYNKVVLQCATDAMTGPGVGSTGRDPQTSDWYKGSKLYRVLDHGTISIIGATGSDVCCSMESDGI